MMRGTRTGCGGLRDGWARPAKRVPAQCSLPRPNHIVPSPPLSGAACCSGTNGGCRGVWASGDSTQTCSKSHRRPTVPYHYSPFPVPRSVGFGGDARQSTGPGDSGSRTAKRSVGSLAALMIDPRRLSHLAITRASFAPTRHRPTCSRFLHPPAAKQITKLPPHARLFSGRERLLPLWATLLQLGRLLSRLKVGTFVHPYCAQGRLAARTACSPRCDARCLPIVPPRLMSALGLPPCPAAPSDSVNLATAALTLAVGGRLGAYMSPSWDSLQHLPLTLSWLDKHTTLKQSHVALRRREAHYKLALWTPLVWPTVPLGSQLLPPPKDTSR